MFPLAFSDGKQLLVTQITKLAHYARKLVSAPTGQPHRSSTPSFGDHGIMFNASKHSKALPGLPVIKETVAAPLLLNQRKMISDGGKSDAEGEHTRPLSWFEDQIEQLQRENRELRQFIISQKRREAEKNQALEILKQQNTQYVLEIDRQSHLVTQFANTVAVAVEDFHEIRSRNRFQDDNARSSSDILSEIIRVYDDTVLEVSPIV